MFSSLLGCRPIAATGQQLKEAPDVQCMRESFEQAFSWFPVLSNTHRTMAYEQTQKDQRVWQKRQIRGSFWKATAPDTERPQARTSIFDSEIGRRNWHLEELDSHWLRITRQKYIVHGGFVCCFLKGNQDACECFKLGSINCPLFWIFHGSEMPRPWIWNASWKGKKIIWLLQLEVKVSKGCFEFVMIYVYMTTIMTQKHQSDSEGSVPGCYEEADLKAFPNSMGEA